MAKLKIITVCGFGLGSSMLLKMKVEEVLKSNDLLANVNVETCDVGSAPSMPVDVIFTSYELGEKMKEQTATPIVMIRNFMDNSEIEAAGLELVKGLIG